MTWKGWTALGIGVFLLTAIGHAPAASVYAWLKPDGASVQVHGLDGTLVRGRVAAVAVGERTVARDLSWELLPLRLLQLRFAAGLKSGDPQFLFDGRVSVSMLGAVRVQDAQAVAAVKSLLAGAGGLYLPVDGQARLQVDELRFEGGLPVAATGAMDISSLVWTLAKEPMPLGDFHAGVETKGQDIIAQLASTSGPLDLTGEAKLSADRSYDLHLQLKPRPDAGESVQTLIRSLGAPDTQGYYHIRRNGKLAPA